MIDLVQLQEDVYGLLMSAPALASVNIVQERRFLVQSQVELDAVWSTPRNGRSGNGVLIEMPALNVTGKNSIFPANLLAVPLVAFQNGDAALTPETGSGLYAEHLAMLLLDLLHHQELKGIGTLYAEEKAVEPARDYEFVNAYRATLFLKTSQTNQTQRCLPVTITNNAGSITLACATAGAEIYYTTDGSTPVKSDALDPINGGSINPASTRYTGAFAANSGDRVRAAAFAFGYNSSSINQEIIA